MSTSTQIRESTLHAFWRSSRYFARPLLTTDGQLLEIIQRGRHNRDAGPDFRGAVVKIAGKMYRGDVEIHLHARDWYAHAHHADPAYNNVILHLALDRSTPPPALLCENGRAVVQLILPQHELSGRSAQNKRTGEEAELPFCPLSEREFTKKNRTVFAAGKLRLEEKAARFREVMQSLSWDQMLYRGICEALGYAKNRQPFLQLSERVPIDLLFSEVHHRRRDKPAHVVSALLFGAAGLLELPEAGENDAEVKAYLAPRLDLWRHLQHTLQIQPLPEAAWQFFRLRPQNFPTRRIAALVELVLKFYGSGMLETLVGYFPASGKKTKETIRLLRSSLIVPARGFWQSYYDFRNKKKFSSRQQIGALLGEKAADEIIINIVLPLVYLYAQESANASLANRVAEVYSAFPSLQSNRIIRKMHKQLFAHPSERATLPTGSEFQQGLIHLHKNFCTPLKCEQCLAIVPD